MKDEELEKGGMESESARVGEWESRQSIRLGMKGPTHLISPHRLIPTLRIGQTITSAESNHGPRSCETYLTSTRKPLLPSNPHLSLPAASVLLPALQR
jgi:acyl-homoserine lactone acylase PvdQ